jgi:hypothetical protein
MALTTVQLGMQGSPQFYGFKNRIINGAMLINQRGATVTATSSNSYSVDRWYGVATSGAFTTQQSSTVPSGAGFTNSLLATVTTNVASPASTDVFIVSQIVEGYNIADLMEGTANAKTITISFWVNSSVTGTYCVGLRSSAGDLGYAATYTISSANTWQQVILTIPGATSGTWVTNNTQGLYIYWDLGSGSNRNISANAWTSGSGWKTSTQTNWISTSGATFYITGVQLEVGSSATSFDYRPYGTELQLCQRYYETNYPIGFAPGSTGTYGFCRLAGTFNYSSTIYNYIAFKVNKRAGPTMTFYNVSTGASGYFDGFTSGVGPTQVAITDNGSSMTGDLLSWTNTSQNFLQGFFTASAEL